MDNLRSECFNDKFAPATTYKLPIMPQAPYSQSYSTSDFYNSPARLSYDLHLEDSENQRCEFLCLRPHSYSYISMGSRF